MKKGGVALHHCETSIFILYVRIVEILRIFLQEYRWSLDFCFSDDPFQKFSSDTETDHTAPEAEVSLILVSNQNLSRGWTFRANATRKWIFQKNLQREPILVLIYTKNLFSTFSVIFSQNLKSILGFKPVTWIYYKSTIKLIFCQVFTKNSLFSGHH